MPNGVPTSLPNIDTTKFGSFAKKTTSKAVKK